MYPKLETLCCLYNKNKDNNKYIFENVDTIKYDYKYFDEYAINIKLIKVDNYMIFIYIDTKDTLLFNGLLEESTDDLTNTYEELKEDLRYLSFEDFINKYYDKLLNNLNS